MNYDEIIERAAGLLKRGETAQQTADAARWELARLTYENTSTGGGPPTDGRVSIKKWAADVRAATGGLYPFSDRTAGVYKALWEFKITLQPGAELSWSDTYAEFHGKTPRKRIAEYEAGGKKARPEVKLEAFRRLAADPAVVSELAAITT